MKYLVFDPERPAGSGWLCLEGLSCYAKWVTLASNATPLSLILASDWAAAYGSGYAVVISVDRAHEEPSLMAAYQETKARQLQATSPWGVYVG